MLYPFYVKSKKNSKNKESQTPQNLFCVEKIKVGHKDSYWEKFLPSYKMAGIFWRSLAGTFVSYNYFIIFICFYHFCLYFYYFLIDLFCCLFAKSIKAKNPF